MTRLFAATGMAICSISLAATSSAQTAFHISNPLSILTKSRLKLECRIDERNSLLFSGAGYWGFNPGFQMFLEYRNYKFVSPATERFFYGKAGYGHCQMSKRLAWVLSTNGAPFHYSLFGGGMGYHFYLNKSKTFFTDLAGGLKLTVTNASNSKQQVEVVNGTFYLGGPGAVVDLNLHIGVQIGSHKLKNTHNKKQTLPAEDSDNEHLAE
jgi:hypothetical protein